MTKPKRARRPHQAIKGPICLKCIHCDFYSGSPGYSEMTPGSPMRWSCLKKHWDMEDANTNGDVLTNISKALNCADYVEAK